MDYFYNGKSHIDSTEEHGIAPSIHYIKLSTILSEKIPTLAVELEGASEVAPAPLLLPPARHPPPAPPSAPLSAPPSAHPSTPLSRYMLVAPCPGSNPPG
jgi:hypothetical protein